jgi:hypothetical protein
MDCNAMDTLGTRRPIGSGLEDVSPPTISEATLDMNRQTLDLADRIGSSLTKLEVRLFGERPTEAAVGLQSERRFNPDGVLGLNFALAHQARERLAVIDNHLSRLHSEI